MPSQFDDFKNLHRGQTIIVCGCGKSLKEFNPPADSITIGVNDVGRHFTPDYLVVLNSKNQFKGDRFHYVENSKAKALFTQLNLDIKHQNIVRFSLGKRGDTDFSGTRGLPFTRNSPYVALCLALYMGAKRIGLIGVDFTDHHFFAHSGRHPLSKNLRQIDLEYQHLNRAACEYGAEIINLSPSSLLTAFPKRELKQLIEPQAPQLRQQTTHSFKQSSKNREPVNMKLEIEKHRGNLIGVFLDTIADSVQELGYQVSRNITRGNGQKNVVRVVWNGRRYHKQKNVVYCEHGWLPREAFQVSYLGINADSHIAPFCYRGGALNEPQQTLVQQYLDSLRRQNSASSEYMLTTAPPVEDLPEEFLLCPLQLERDTNIERHAPVGLKRMQALIDYVSRWNPSIPVVFKQHPSDAKKQNQQLLLRLRRKKDVLRHHSGGNIHQILKTGACRGIISINSNVVHDGFLWDVPAIVLGKNIWPQEGLSPFMNSLPNHWRELDQFYLNQEVTDCRGAYIYYLMQNQWTMEDVRDCGRVAQLLNSKNEDLRSRGKVVSISSFSRKQTKKPQTTINVVAENKGWLFEDLKKYYASLSIPGVSVLASDKPYRFSDAWIFLRAKEAHRSPDLSRTLVQIHDQFDGGYYRPGGDRHCISEAGALCLTNMEQKRIIQASGIDLSGKRLMIRPTGAHRDFTLREKMPGAFTVAWAGRPVNYGGREIKRLHWLVEALKHLEGELTLKAHLIGDRLLSTQKAIQELGFDCRYFPRSRYSHADYPSLFKQIDCLLITAELAAGPNALFEALAAGVPVIAANCGWASSFVRHNDNGYLVDSPKGIAESVAAIAEQRELWFNRREYIRQSLGNCWLQTWLEESVEAAVELAAGAKGKTTKFAL